MIDVIVLNKWYTNRDDAEFRFKPKEFVLMHLTGKLNTRLDHIPAVLYVCEDGGKSVISVETFKEQFRLVNKGE